MACDPPPAEERPPEAPTATVQTSAPSTSASTVAAPSASEVVIGGDPPAPQPQQEIGPSAPNIIHGVKPTIFRQMDIGPEVVLHGYSDCHLGSGAEVQCSGPIDVELLGHDRGPVVSAPSPKDITERAPNRVKLFKQSLCHDFFVRLRAKTPVKCDVAVHAIIYPD